jgi:hypothetical protein
LHLSMLPHSPPEDISVNRREESDPALAQNDPDSISESHTATRPPSPLKNTSVNRREESNSTTVTCSICLKTFKKSFLPFHMLRQHRDERPQKVYKSRRALCQYCQKVHTAKHRSRCALSKSLSSSISYY